MNWVLLVSQVTLKLYSEQEHITSQYIGAHMSHHHQGIPTLNWNSDKIPTLLHVCGGLDEEDGNGADWDDDLGTDDCDSGAA